MEEALVLDPYSGIDHKDLSALGSFPGYYSADQKRRLTAYQVFSAYLETVARELLPADGVHKPSELQEFGDAAVLVERVAAAVLGEDPAVTVIGAEAEIEDKPDIPDPPEPPGDDLEPEVAAIRQRIFDVQLARWETEAERIVSEWERSVNEAPLLQERHDWLRSWADADRLFAKLRENESENIVALGDGVIVIGWDPDNRRPKTEVLEPDAYMPILDDAEPSQFPTKVHLVWQFSEFVERGDSTEEVKLVRRITFELVRLDEVDVEVSRPLYLAPDDEHTHVCLHSDGVWLLEDFDRISGLDARPREWKTIPGDAEGEEIELNRYPTGLDFIPVLHLPNTLSSRHHFGRSLIARLAQLLDEVAAADSDESLASRYAAKPLPIIDGLPAGQMSINLTPGKAIAGKSAGIIDMARQLTAIVERNKGLLKRLAVNAQVPEGLLGRVDASEVPSGLALTLSFTPFVQLVGLLREARRGKYPLLLKWSQRIAIQNGEESGIQGTEVYPAEVRFGSFMPQDLPGTATVVNQLLSTKAISRLVASTMLQEAGIPIEDVGDEVARIDAGDAETALQLAEALASGQYAAEFLGIEGYEDPLGVDAEAGAVIPPVGAGAPFEGA